MPVINYTTIEISEFLKLWGKSFKGLDAQKYPNAAAYYQACVDAHLYLNNKEMVFYTLGGLRRTLLLIAAEFEAEWKSKRQPESYKQRAELLRYIVNNLLIHQPMVQKSIF